MTTAPSSVPYSSPLRQRLPNSVPCWLPFPQVALPQISLRPLDDAGRSWLFGFMLAGRYRGFAVEAAAIPALLFEFFSGPEAFTEKHFPGDLARASRDAIGVPSSSAPVNLSNLGLVS